MQFPLVNAKASYLQDIVVLTRSVRDNPSTGFCKCLENFGIKGQDFDAIKNDFCALRKSGQLPFCSVDCFIEAKGKYYFIEFKKSTTPGLNGIECHDGDPIDVSLKKKAFDSLAIAPLTVLQHDSGEQIMRKAEYIFVRLSDFSDVSGFDAIADTVYSLAKSKDSIYPECQIRWGLEKLRDLGLFADVHTWPETKFVDWAKKNLLPA